jgi:photosystem II stability/assembly factor-like uncharacterized protein
LRLERLENRELLSNDAPFIAAVSPTDGSTTSTGQPTLLVKFSEDVIAAQAQNPANYLLFGTGGRSISIDAAMYDSGSHQVMLSYNGGAPLTADQYTLFVRGDQIHDVDDNLPLAQSKQLVVANAGASNVSLVTVPGDSSIQALTDYASPGTSLKPSAAVVAQLRSNAFPDLVVANSNTDTVQIFRGLAAGVFENTPSTTLPLPAAANPQGLIVANLANPTGLPDIAVADFGTNSVTVFLNNGQGQFGAGTSYAVGNNPIAIVAGSFSGRSTLDLAVADNAADTSGHYDVTVLPGDPINHGKFLAAVSVDTGLTRPNGIAAGTNLKDSTNRLSTGDLVVSAANGARVLFNSTATVGVPNFSQGPALTTTATSAVAVGQVSRLNRPDIVATTKTGGGQVLVFQNLGSGIFSSGNPFAANSNPTSVALGDLNGDGQLDVIVSNGNSPGTVSVLLNQTLGTISFASPTAYTVDADPVAVSVHVNSQTKVVDDVVAANAAGNDASLLRNKGDGTLFVSNDIPLTGGAASSVVVGDLNGDHLPDIVLGSTAGGLFLTSSTVTILLSQPGGTFAPPVTLNIGTSLTGPSLTPLGLALADLTRTGREDILVTNPADGTLTILANSGTGVFTALTPIMLNTVPGSTYSPTGIAVGDFRHTGNLDVAISHNGTKSGVTFLAGNGDRTFATPVELTVTLNNAVAIAAADFERSGNLDLAVVDDTQTGRVVVLHNSGSGTFTQLGAFPAGENPSAIAVGDLNGDGFPDIAVTNRSVPLTSAGTGNLYVTALINQQGVRFNSTRLSPDIDTGTTGALSSIAITSLTRTPFPAIVVTESGGVNNLVSIQSLGGGQFALPQYYATSGGGVAISPSYVAVASDPFIRATTFTVSSTLVSANLVANGTFETPDLTGETGNLAGWQTFEQTNSHGQWTTQSSPSSPLSAVAVAPPPQGKYAAMLDEADTVIPQANDFTLAEHQINQANLYAFNGFIVQPTDYEGMHVLYQDIAIPVTATKATLSFSLYINNNDPENLVGYTDPLVTSALDYFPTLTPRRANQQVRVDLIDPLGSLTDVGGGVLRNLFLTTPTTDRDFGSYRTFTFDITALAGRTVRLRIASVNNQGKLIVGVDKVQMQAVFTDNTVPGVNGLHLRTPGFGATPSFGGNTTDPTIVGQVTDLAGVNNIASVIFDLRDSGATFSNGQATFQVNDFDVAGNFVATLPLGLPGIYTVGVTAVTRGGASTRSTIIFNFQGPSLTNWQAVGPAPIRYDNQGVSYKTVSGRITSIALDPRDPNGNIIYVSTDNGGVWKTTDGGADWTPLTDFVNDPNGGPVPIAIGGVAVDPGNPNNVYAATGVGDNEVTSQPGIGVLRSTDGGQSWTLVGANVFTGSRVSKIAVSRPGRNGLTSIYVAVTAGGAFGPGVYRSQDGGATWSNVLDPTKMFLDNNTAVGAGHSLASVTDLVIDRLSDFDEDIWIGLGNIGIVPTSDTGGVWKSPDGGNSWLQVIGGHDSKNGTVVWSPTNNNGPTGIASTELPSAPDYPSGGGSNIGHVTIALAQSNPQFETTMYVYIGTPPAASGSSFMDTNQKSEIDKGLQNSFGLFKSKNGGESWTHVMLRENVPSVMPPDPRVWLNLFTMGHEASDVGALVVDPNNPNVVYVGGSTRYLMANDQQEFPRAHGFIRVDTTNMRDVDLISPEYMGYNLPVVPNDGDDIIKAGDGAAVSFLLGGANANLLEKGTYPGMMAPGHAYNGEGVFWYDLQTTDAGQQNTNFLTYTPQLLIPATIHSLVFDPLGRLLIGTEGGIYRGVNQGWVYDTTDGASGIDTQASLPPDKQESSIETSLGVPTPSEPGMIFTDLNGDLQIADVTSIAIDPYSRQTLDISLQSIGWAQTTGPLEWSSTNESIAAGAGGFFDSFRDEGPFSGDIRTGPRDPTAPAGSSSTVYRTFAYVLFVLNEVSISFQSGQGGTFQPVIKGLNLSLGGTSTFSTLFPPLIMNSQKLLDAKGNYQDEIMYGTDKAFETDNNASAWDQVSTALSPGNDITAMAFGPGTDQFYVGTINGLVFVDLHGGGDGFPNRSAGLPGGIVNGITVDPRDPNTAYVMLGGTGGHLFRTTDAGRTWTDVDSNLPSFPTYSMVIDPRSFPGAPNGTIYVGTQVGVYVSTDNAATWTRFGNGMPNVPVRDLQFSQDYEELVAGTLGRGAFTISTQHEGPRVVGVTPGAPASPGLSSVTVTFDHPVDPRKFTIANIQTLTGPNGPITPLAVNDLDPVNHQSFQIVFLPQTTDGIYSLTIAPTVQDFLGNNMDENGNGINGENPGDAFSANFVINSTDNGTFVTGLYHDLLSRQADNSGFVGFISTVDPARFSFLQPIAQAFVTSGEARADLISNGTITSQHPTATGYYPTLLGRAASAGEIAPWLQALQQGATPEQVIAAIASSGEFFQVSGGNDAGFVNDLYTNPTILGRSSAPSAGEINGWLGFLSQTEMTARSNVLNAFFHSDEYRILLINTFYSKYLGRPASSGDIGVWLPQLQNGMSDETFLASLVGSDEYFANHGGTNTSWLSGVYNDLLNRPPDPPGEAAFLGQLQAGVSRSVIALQLEASTEYRTNLIQSDFGKYLGRGASPTEVGNFLGALQSGLSDEGLATIVLASAEYYAGQRGTATTLAGNDANWINAIYPAVLNRPADGGGSASFLQFLAQTESAARAGVVQAFVGSTEYRAHVITVNYTTYLMRAPATQEIALWMPLLSQPSAGPGKASPDEIFTSIVLGSSEYFLRPEQRGSNGLLSNTQWLTTLYNRVLGRAPDAGGLNAQLTTLLGDYAPQRLALATTVDTSAEYRTHLVTVYYKTYLRRSPSAAEIPAPVAELAAGVTDEQLISSLVSSQEYFQNPNLGGSDNSKWLNQAYLDILGRPRDTAGSQAFLAALNNSTLTRTQVANLLLASTEYRQRLVTQLFTADLGRGPSTSELNNSVAALAAGTTDEQLIAQLVSTNEYFLRTHTYP